jgi:haloacetate dehalogenase
MEHLGFTEFAVVGHDRGAYVAHRLAVDHVETKGLVVMDAVPIWEALERCNRHFAAAWWHWFFLGQRDKPAERIINADPEGWYQITPDHMGDEAFADLRQALHDPTVIHAMCEDYRAGLRIDRDDEEADRRTGRFTTCPALIMWAEFDDMEDLYGDPVEVWRSWLPGLRRGERIPSGHHMAEEAPAETAAAIHTFLREVI